MLYLPICNISFRYFFDLKVLFIQLCSKAFPWSQLIVKVREKLTYVLKAWGCSVSFATCPSAGLLVPTCHTQHFTIVSWQTSHFSWHVRLIWRSVRDWRRWCLPRRLKAGRPRPLVPRRPGVARRGVAA